MSRFEPADGRLPDSGLLLHLTRSTNAFEETVQRLLQAVRLGLISPGERLPAERELAVRLGISRDTLREAIAALADAGYLVARRGRYGGTFVVDALPRIPPVTTGQARPEEISRAELEDALVLRRILDVGAAKQAAMCELSGPERGRLWAAYEDCRDAGADDFRRLDSRFHMLIVEATGAPSLVPLAADARMRVNALLDRIPLLAPNIEHSSQQHEVIVRAILHGQPELAAAAMEEHTAATEALLRGFLG